MSEVKPADYNYRDVVELRALLHAILTKTGPVTLTDVEIAEGRTKGLHIYRDERDKTVAYSAEYLK